MEPRIISIIVNYECADEVKSVAGKLQELGSDICIVDNSGNEQLQTISSQNEYDYIQTGENLGNVGGNTVGVKKHYRDYEYIFLANADIEIKNEELLESLLNKIESENKIKCMSPLILNSDGSIQTFPPYPVPKLFRRFGLLPEMCEMSRDDIVVSDALKACSMLIDTNLFEEIGFFNEEYFMYREETEFCYRARMFGYENAIDMEVSIYHPEPEDLRHNTRLQIYYDIRNRFHLARSLFSGYELLIAYAITSISIISQIVKILGAGKPKLLLALVQGVLDGVRGVTGRTKYADE